MASQLSSPRSRTASAWLAVLLTAATVFFAAFTNTAQAISATGQRVLVVLPRGTSASQYSSFFADLAERGLQHSVRDVSAAEPKLVQWDERQFDHLIWLADDLDAPPSDLRPQDLVDFAKRDGNILFAYGPNHADWFASLAKEFSIDLAPKGHHLVDHFNVANAPKKLGSTKSSVMAISGGRIDGNSVVFSQDTLASAQSTPLVASDISPHVLGPNPLLFPLLRASSTSYTTSASGDGSVSSEESLLGTDPNVAIVSAFQLKDNSARVTFLGSKSLFLDDATTAKSVKSPRMVSSSSLNAAFLRDVTSWTFQEHGVLRIDRRSHYRVRSGPNDVREAYEEPAEGGSAKMYRIKDTVSYSVDISQHSPTQGWIPAPDDLDLQVSLVMIDPFITTSLFSPSSQPHSEGSVSPSSDDPLAPSSLLSSPPQTNTTTRYSTSFRLPDRLGVYTFHVKWARTGWTYLESRDVAPIRAFNHDEGERFLPASWPYAAASLSTVVAFVLFVTLWLFTAEGDDDKKKSKAKTA